MLSQEHYFKVLANINAQYVYLIVPNDVSFLMTILFLYLSRKPFEEKVTELCVLLGDHPELVLELNKCIPGDKAFRIEDGKIIPYNA